MSTSLLFRNIRVSLACGWGRGAKRALFRSPVASLQLRRPVIDTSYSSHFMDFKGSSIPSAMKKLVVTKLSQKFRDAVSLQTVPVPTPDDGDLLIRNRFIGINASDINYSAGRYDTSVKPPFNMGFEGIGEVVGVGLSASAHFTVGDTVAYFVEGAFAEYSVIPAKKGVRMPAIKPEFLAILLSGATAYIALKKLGELTEGQTVLVTAAAGGTGQFAVQFSKAAGCHVIGLCSSDTKAGFLKTIGCDRPINYRKEDLSEVLRREYPRGVDVIYESVGGDVFDLAINNLAVKGRLIIIGFISGYQSDLGLAPVKTTATALPVKLLKKSASMHGFFLPHYLSDYGEALASMLSMHARGKLVCEVDRGDAAPGGRFVGLESVFRAVDHMYNKGNLGKVVVALGPEAESKL
ncbi:prostaglandin reductase-3-like [Brienomyrus brachyistius]|uniref:prostaglandin reductase-3-like n=1 Tax=Brienomyrus brachyistius TaxID=42636 RepID=UPI0020B1C898|nr:prostaglandin reductase-3-like [Brienomyrus brachyistius]